jgi:hypothetical protein
MGYGPPLPAPIPAVQTTLAAIDLPELHQYVQENDAAALANCDEEGVHQPLLIDSLDLSLWTSLFVTATTDPTKTMANIKSAQARLGDLLMQDEHETTRSIGICSMIEEALRLANNDALDSTSLRSIIEPNTETCNNTADTDTTHPLLAKMNISSAERSVLEDFTETLSSSQTEKDKQTLVFTKGPVVPVKPSRCVELLVADHQHRMWAVGNTNLLAPITIPMWKMWAGMSETEVEHCKKQALNNVGVLRAPVDLIPAFSLNMFEHSKCTTTEVKLHTKQDLPTGYNRKESHLAEFWNVQRPYMRCLYNPRATSGCRGSIIWFDHAIWAMINKLEMFFPNQPNSTTRFAAFMLWLSSAAKIAVKAAIVFCIGREHMIEAAIQLSENPSQKLLPNLQDNPLATKIERLLKGPKFSLMHPGSPSQVPSPFKKQRLNLNTPPSEHAGQGGRGRSPGNRGFIPHGSDRGFRGRGSGRSYIRREGAEGTSPNTASTASTPGTERVPAGDKPSPLKKRVLLWEDS